MLGTTVKKGNFVCWGTKGERYREYDLGAEVWTLQTCSPNNQETWSLHNRLILGKEFTVSPSELSECYSKEPSWEVLYGLSLYCAGYQKSQHFPVSGTLWILCCKWDGWWPIRWSWIRTVTLTQTCQYFYGVRNVECNAEDSRGDNLLESVGWGTCILRMGSDQPCMVLCRAQVLRC
jgi:hypothetical protein